MSEDSTEKVSLLDKINRKLREVDKLTQSLAKNSIEDLKTLRELQEKVRALLFQQQSLAESQTALTTYLIQQDFERSVEELKGRVEELERLQNINFSPDEKSTFVRIERVDIESDLE